MLAKGVPFEYLHSIQNSGCNNLFHGKAIQLFEIKLMPFVGYMYSQSVSQAHTHKTRSSRSQVLRIGETLLLIVAQ